MAARTDSDDQQSNDRSMQGAIYKDDANPFNVLRLTASLNIRQDTIMEVYKTAISHVFKRGERASATRDPLIPTQTQLNRAKDNLNTNKKIAHCYDRLCKKPYDSAK